MLVLGIDPGTATTGYGLVQETNQGEYRCVDYGTIKTGKEQQAQDRLLKLFDELNKLLLLHKPDKAVVEKLFFQTNTTTAIAVGQARGVILLGLAQHTIPVSEYTPLQVKQAVSGYGKADKSQVIKMVQMILGLKESPEPDDAADGLALAICYLNNYRIEKMKEDTSDN